MDLLRGRRPSTLGSFRHTQFRLLWAGLTTSRLGDGMQQFALGWLIVLLAVRDGAPQLAAFR